MPITKFVAFFPEDFERDTQHLSDDEELAYFRLLRHCWKHGSIPLDNDAVKKISKFSRHKWRKVWPNISGFFDPLGRNKRATIEREKAEKTSLRQAMAGHRGMAKRWGNGHNHGYSHGYPPGDNHGVTIKKERITTTSSVAAREGSTSTEIPVTDELKASIAAKLRSRP